MIKTAESLHDLKLIYVNSEKSAVSPELTRGAVDWAPLCTHGSEANAQSRRH